jgi:hypothetical protein
MICCSIKNNDPTESNGLTQKTIFTGGERHQKHQEATNRKKSEYLILANSPQLGVWQEIKK